MSPQDWEQIKQVFAAALNVSAAEREAYVRHACGEREDIRTAVAELLVAHHDASQSFLEPTTIVVRADWLFRVDDCVAGRFRVVKRIARGTMGEVYQVHDERLGLDVALKAIRPELLGDAETVARFRREVLVTRNIAHEGLCRVFDLVEHPMPKESGLPEGTIVPCLTMQLLDGQSLEDWLTAHRPMPAADALPLIRQIGEALQVLHDAGVVHRDLKPSNVMLIQSASGPRAVLTDFGLARPLAEGLFETQASRPGGAPFFMAPELFRGERPSCASDIYAFGLVIDEMVTRERAFPAESLHALLLDKLNGGPLRPRQRAHGLPRSWDAAICRCLAAEPPDRFASAADVVAALDGSASWLWRGHMPIRRQLRRGWRAAMYATAAVLALSGLAAVGRGSPPATSVVILPFSNLTGVATNDYLSKGTAAELSRRLSRVPGWSVFAAGDPDTKVDPSKQATFSLRGHVQEADASSLRITAELRRIGDGTVLWSRNFEGPREKALALEERLAGEALGALVNAAASMHPGRGLLSLAGAWFSHTPFGARTALPPQGTSNSAAYDAYLRARYLSEERTLSTARAAGDLYQQAIALDPNFAAPFTGLADLQSVLADLHYAPHGQLMDDAERYAMQAVAIDPNLPEAQLSLAAVRQMQSKWNEAEAAYRRALELHPAFSRGHRWFGGMLLQFGRFEESLYLYERALDLDPYDVPSHSAYGLALFYARHPFDAVTHLQSVLEQKDFVHARFILGQVYAQLAGIDPAKREYLVKALGEADALRSKKTEATDRYANLVAALAWTYYGDLLAAQPFVDFLDQGWRNGTVPPSFPARVYAVQGRAPDALSALEAAESDRDRELMYLTVSPLYDRIRHEPRFEALVQRMGLK